MDLHESPWRLGLGLLIPRAERIAFLLFLSCLVCALLEPPAQRRMLGVDALSLGRVTAAGTASNLTPRQTLCSASSATLVGTAS